MNQYETVIVLTPLLSEEVAKEVLAYPIEKKASGFFHLTEYKSSGELINKLELELKRDERVLRFLTIRLDRHAVAYNEKKRSGAFNKKPKKEEAAA